LAAIVQNYSRSPYLKNYLGIFEDVYSRPWEYLVDIDMHLIQTLADCLGLGQKKIVRSSTLDVQGDRIERLIRICEIFGADTFYEGASGRNYINEQDFLERGVRVEYQSYQHPVYGQLYGDFIPNLSVIDLLFNHGKESLAIITGQTKGDKNDE